MKGKRRDKRRGGRREEKMKERSKSEKRDERGAGLNFRNPIPNWAPRVLIWICFPGGGALQPLTGESAAKGFLYVRQKIRRQHINLTLSLVCAPSPRAHVSVFLGPKQLTGDVQDTASRDHQLQHGAQNVDRPGRNASRCSASQRQSGRARQRWRVTVRRRQVQEGRQGHGGRRNRSASLKVNAGGAKRRDTRRRSAER